MLFRQSRSTGDVERLAVGGTVVGLLPGASYSQAAVAIEPGDLLVLFTDGITESMNAADEEWGELSVIETVKRCIHCCPREMIAHIMRAADEFAAGAEQHDDMTMVILRFGYKQHHGTAI
jgi:phosphoserine phosphatase RsbU/P